MSMGGGHQESGGSVRGPPKLDIETPKKGEPIVVPEKGTIGSKKQPVVVDEIPSIQQNMINTSLAGKSEKQKVQKSVEILNRQLREKRSGLGRLGSGIRSTSDWRNSDLVTKEYIDICTYTKVSEKNQKEICEYALQTLTRSLTMKGMAAILMCAWGLTSTEDHTQRVFKDNKMSVDGISYEKLDTNILIDDEEGGIITHDPTIMSTKKFEMEVCYLCAAVLRLATKDHENIIRARHALKKSYSNFYQEAMTLDVTMSSDCLSRIRDLLQNRLIVKNTLALFLLEFARLEGNDRGMCRMLFELHLSYTGMHAYNLLMYCAERSGTPISVLFAILKHPNTTKALDLAEHLMLNYEFPETEEAKERVKLESSTWRYARLFDPDAFRALQTKNTMMLTSILALIAQKIGTTGAGDVTKIRQVANMIERNHEMYNKLADRAVSYMISLEPRRQ